MEMHSQEDKISEVEMELSEEVAELETCLLYSIC